MAALMQVHRGQPDDFAVVAELIEGSQAQTIDLGAVGQTVGLGACHRGRTSARPRCSGMRSGKSAALQREYFIIDAVFRDEPKGILASGRQAQMPPVLFIFPHWIRTRSR